MLKTLRNAYRLFTFLFISLFFVTSASSQDNPANTFCGTPDSMVVFNGPIGTTTINVVFVFLDFPDGRLPNGQIPATDGELAQVSNIDAVLNMGFNTTNRGITYNQKVRKYTYDDFWNMYFSTNTFTGNAHPDWNSHGAFGYPLDGDTARAFGSFKEYFSEVSYGKLTINPFVTHQNETGIYRTGIVNNIIDVNGAKIIRPIKFTNNKSHYFRDSDEIRAFGEMLTEAPGRLYYYHSLPPTDPDYIEFDLQNFNGKVIYVFAGGSTNVGGLAAGNCIVREKRNKNYPGDDRGKIINGLTIYCHEFGHLLGFRHDGTGNYSPMTNGTFNQNCPSHFSIVTKLKAGWVDPQYVRFINSNQTITDLPPSIYNGDCAIITIYGKAGYSEIVNSPNYSHSEYYVIENRRMLRNNPNYKFDKKFVWQRENYPTTGNGFNGGCLITQYSPYNLLQVGYPLDVNSSIKIINADRLTPLLPETEGHSNHFFGVQVLADVPFTFLTDNDGGIDRTKSSFDLKTGIKLTNIIDPGNGNISFNLNYSLGEPPNYQKVLYGQALPNPFIMNGEYFLHTIPAELLVPIGGNIIIEPGTVIEALNRGLIYYSGNSGNFEANGTVENPITFRGAGYQNYRLFYKNFVVKNINNSNTNSIVIQNCNFVSDISGFEFSVSNANSNKSIEIENININGSGSAGFTVDNSQTNLSINNLNFASSVKSINFSSATNNQNHAGLTQLQNSNFDEYHFSGTWRIDLPNDIVIAENKKIFVSGPTGGYNEIIFTTPHKIIVNGEANILGSFTTNKDIQIGSTGKVFFKAWDRVGVPSMDNFVRFSAGYGIISNGIFSAISVKDSLIFTVNSTGKWNGIKCLNNKDFTMNNVKVRNALTGVEMSKPNTNIYIQNSRFSDNLNYDIFLDNLHTDFRATRLIKNNIFTGNPDKTSSIICNNGLDVRIENNQFDEDYSLGISLLWMTNPVIKENLFKATTTQGYSPYGIFSYSSGGFYSCNNITNYLSGIKLDNSSPYIFNNDIYNNGVGLYCENSSNPVLSPSFSQNQTLYIGGYNRIFNNLNEEIYCNNNNFVPLSLPILSYGSNSIYDGNQDCLIDIGITNGDVMYPVENNYWGGGSPQGRLCPQNVNYIFAPYLAGEPEPPGQCDPYLESSNNSNLSQTSLLFGSANIDDFNGNINSAIAKYKLLVDPENSIQLSLASISKILYSISKDTTADYYALENYYSSLSSLYQTDTLFSHRTAGNSTFSDVEQPSYPEALDEYQAVINNPLNEAERHYAFIDQLHTIRLMLDSLLNGFDNSAMSFNMNDLQLKATLDNILKFKVTNNSQNTLKDDFEKNSNTKNIQNEKLISSITKSDKDNQINKIYKSFKLESINLSVLSNTEKVSLLNNIIAFKLYEFSILNDNHNTRPLDRMNIQRKYSLKTNNLPKVFKLYQNYPNPFNPVSTIKYDIPKSSKVLIKIYDLLGREVMTLVNEAKEPGAYEAYFNGINLASGVYIYRIESGTFVDSKKMVLIK